MPQSLPGHAKYPTVFTPVTLNKLTIRNRIFVPAHTTSLGEHHLPSQRHVDYHRERARGGVGAIVFEAIRVADNTLGRPQGVAGYLPGAVDAYRRVVDAVHAEGAALIAQICHMGRQIDGEFERTVSVSASDLRWSPTAVNPRPMDRAEMDAVRDAHARVARNMVEAGMDGIELHWGHGHLLQQFLSPLSNDRDDDYGGSVDNRMRFPLEVLRAVREAVGPDFCVGIRISAEEYIDGGLTLEMSREIAVKAVAACQIDFIHVSHSAYHMSHSLGTQMADMAFPVEPFRQLPRGIREALRAVGDHTPVLTVCKYRDLGDAEAMLAAGHADMVGMARAHVADPALVRKHAEGREREIRRCLGCNQGCAQRLEKNLSITCLINPRVGLEGRWPEAEDDPAATRRRVLVVGGGPGGCEAAWVAAARGHEVTLWERGDRLGGALAWTEPMRLRRDFGFLLKHQAFRLEQHGVRIETGREADADTMLAFGADALVVATGAAPAPVVLPDGSQALTMEEALADPAALGDRVAVYDLTGEWSALGFIEHLADLGKRVSVFTPVGAFAWRTTIYSTLSNRKRLREKGVRIALLRALRGFGAQGLVLEDVSTGETLVEHGFDSLVGVQYGRPESALEKALKARLPQAGGPVLRAIGDCLSPRTALEAVYEGHEIARAL